MNKIIILSFFLIMSSSAIAQQILWTTLKDSTSKYIPMDNVSEKVLEYYDLYEFYYDVSGFNKESFFEMFEDSAVEKMRLLFNKLEEPAVFAFRTNSPEGSLVFIMIVSKENINMVLFNNFYQEGGMITYSTRRELFGKWFGTLLE